jgi:hypothetical protein
MNSLRITDLEHCTTCPGIVSGGFKLLDIRVGTVTQVDVLSDTQVGRTPKTSSFKVGLAAGFGTGIAVSYGKKSVFQIGVGTSIG